MALFLNNFAQRSTSTYGSPFIQSTIPSAGSSRTSGSNPMWSISSLRPGGAGVGKALGNDFSNASSGSLSNNFSTNKMDWDAKAKTDAQIQAGLEYAKQLRGQAAQQSTDRISGLQDSYGELQSKVDDLGQYDRDRINRDALNAKNSVAARLAGSGLLMSTVTPTLEQGVERNRLEAQGQLDERLRNQSISTLLAKIQNVDAANADQITRDSQLGQVIAELYARIGGNQPRISTQESDSRSASAR